MRTTTIKPVMIGLVYCSILSFVILRVFLLTPGLWQFNDSNFNYNLDLEKAHSFSTWNRFRSADNGRDITRFGWQSWLFLIGTSELAQKLGIFVSITIPALCLFVVAYKLAENRFKSDFGRHASAFAASTIGIMNPFVAMRVNNSNYVFNIGVSAVTFYLVHKSINENSKKRVVKYALILSPLQALNSLLPHTILLTYLLVGLVITLEMFYSCASKPRRVTTVFKNGLLFSCVTVIATFMLLSYWILPYLTSFLGQYVSNPNKAAYELVLSPINPIYRSGSVINAFRGLVSWWTPIYFAQTGAFSILWVLSSFIVPLMSFFAFLIRPKDKIVHILTITAIIGVLLASGPRGPFAAIYLWISSHIPLASTIMYDQDVFTMYIIFSFSILFAITVGTICERIKWNAAFAEGTASRKTIYLSLKKMPWRHNIRSLSSLFLLFLVFSASIIAAYPLVTGDLGGFLIPTELPASYKSMNSWLNENLGGHRAMWAPTELWNIPGEDGGWKVNWLPNTKIKIYPSDFLGYAPEQWIFYPTLGSLDRLTYAFVINSLINNKTRNIGKILETTNTKFLVYHGDTVYPDETLYRALSEQNDLKQIRNFGGLYAFENENTPFYVYGVNKTLLIVGGLDSLLSLAEVQYFDPTDYAVVFLEQRPTPLDLLDQLTNFDTKLMFYGNKNFDDLILDTLSSKYYYGPFNYFTTSASYNWTINSLTDWVGLQGYLPNLPFKHEFDLAQGFIQPHEEEATFDMPVSIQSTGQYEIWMRLMLQSTGGSVAVSLNGGKGTEINTQIQLPSEAGFKWIRVSTSTLAEGKNLLTIKNDDGHNIINSVAIVPIDVLVQHAKNVIDLIDNSKASIVFLPYPYVFPESQDLMVYDDNFANLSNWQVQGGWNYETEMVTSPGSPGTIILNKTYGNDLTISVDGMIEGEAQLTILFRLGNGTGYSFELRGWSNTATISKFTDGYAVSNFVTRSYSLERGRWYSLKVSVQGDEIRGYIDNTLIFDIYDSSFKGQAIGLHSYNGVVSYKNFKVSIPQITMSTPWPTKRDYIAAVQKEGQVNNSHWVHYGPSSLMANQTALTTLNPESAKQLIIYSVDNEQKLEIDSFFKGEKVNAIVGYNNLDAANSVIAINASSSFILVYMEGYNDLWQATANNTVLYHLPVYSAMNAFIIGQNTHESTVTITFLPEQSFKTGSIISLISLAAVLVSLIFLQGNRHTNRTNEKSRPSFFDEWYARRRVPKSKPYFSAFYSEHAESPRDLLSQAIYQNKASILVDVGCGDGDHTLFVKKCGVSMVIGIDLSLPALHLAKKEIQASKSEGKFVLADATKLPFPKAFANMVVVIGVIHHTGNPLILKEASRVLKDDGHFFLEEVTLNPLAFLLEKAFNYGPRSLKLRLAETSTGTPHIELIATGYIRSYFQDFDVIVERHEWLFVFPLLYIAELSPIFEKCISRISLSFLISLWRIERTIIDRTPGKKLCRFVKLWCIKKH